MSRAACLLLLTFSNAHAEAPWNIALSAGPDAHRFRGNGERDVGLSSRFDAGYRVVDRTAVGAGIGVHLGLSFVRTRDHTGARETYMPFEVGLGAQLVLADRVLVLPWAGLLDLTRYSHRTSSYGLLRSRAVGVQVGYDIIVRARNRISAVCTVATTWVSTAGERYNSIGAGIAYRYW